MSACKTCEGRGFYKGEYGMAAKCEDCLDSLKWNNKIGGLVEAHNGSVHVYAIQRGTSIAGDVGYGIVYSYNKGPCTMNYLGPSRNPPTRTFDSFEEAKDCAQSHYESEINK